MTAQHVDPASRRPWSPDPVRQRLANHTIEDILTLPDDAPRAELRDGVIIVVPLHVHAYELVGDRYELVAESAEELVLAKPFEARLRVRDVAP